MGGCRPKGVITVFLSLVSVLFLSLICTMAESARVQGARVKAEAVLNMGLFSVFGEYEKKLLDQYDILFLDGAYGSGTYHTDKVRLRMEEFMSYNINPNKGLSGSRFDPLKMQLEESNITGIVLATDEEGEPFYQQAVTFMKDNLGTEILNKLKKESDQAKEQEEAQKLYEESDKNNVKQLEDLKKQEAERIEQEKERIEQEAENKSGDMDSKLPGTTEEESVSEEVPVSGEVTTLEGASTPEEVSPPVENPLEIIKKVKEMGILALVLKDPDALSQKALDLSSVPSGRSLEKGSLPIIKEEGGVSGSVLFQEYLLEHFPHMTSQKEKGALDYQLEYILCGKGSDQENLKGVVNRLLLLREGSNFLYALSNQDMQAQAGALAAAIVGILAVPGLVTVTKMALLLAWAYGESLLDVRTLLSGGKIALEKTADTWKLSLENLGRITELLQEDGNSDQKGLTYPEYLRMLLFTGKKAKYPMRGLDLIEANLRMEDSTKNFRADACMDQVKVNTKWTVQPLFMKVSGAFLGIGGETGKFEVEGNFSY